MEYFGMFKDSYARSERKEFGYNEKTRREALYYIGLYYKTISRADSALICFQQCADLSRAVDKKEETGYLVNSVLYAGMMADALGKRGVAVAYYNQVLDLKKFGTSRESAKLYLQAPYKFF
jgi:tetratricopeptide (TPR) repeat protein